MPATTSKSATTSSVSASPKDCGGPPKTFHSGLVLRPAPSPPTPKELPYEPQTHHHRLARHGASIARGRCARGIGTHCSGPLPGHCSHSRETEVHDIDRSTTHREDNGGRNRRQGFLDCGCCRQLLLRASCQGGNHPKSESDYRQGQHIFVHFAGRFWHV